MIDSQQYSLFVHTATHSTHEVILNQEIFPKVKENDYIQIFDISNSNNNSYDLRNNNKLILRVSSLQAKGGGRLEISILKSIADSFNLASYTKVCVQVIQSKDAEVDFVEFAFRKQFVQRGDMTRLKNSMLGKTVHINQTIDLEGLNMLVQEISFRQTSLKCGVITENTNLVFRSRSARVFWLVQISAEMWDTDKNGNLYFEVFLNRFVEPVIDRWKQLGVTHSLSIIFFTRTYYYGESTSLSTDMQEESPINAAKCLVSVDENLSYQDFYKIVLDNCTYTDKTLFIRSMKKEFWDFPRILNWRMDKEKFKQVLSSAGSSPFESFGPPESYYAVPSGSSGGNVLEAINTTLNVLSKHYMDRDLERTGNSIVMISAGVGFFEVQSKLARITQQRMMDSGIGMDFISLSQPPLHIVPLFYELPPPQEGGPQTQQLHADGGSYSIPHWINLQFVNLEMAPVDCTTDSKSNSNKNSNIGATSKSDHQSGVAGHSSNMSLSENIDKSNSFLESSNKKTIKGGGAVCKKSVHKKNDALSKVENNDKYLKTGSSVALYTTEEFNFSPFPFGEILQCHVDCLGEMSDIVTAPASKALITISNGVIDTVLNSKSRSAMILRLLSLPRSLEKYLAMSSSIFESRNRHEETEKSLSNVVPSTPPSTSSASASSSKHLKVTSLIRSREGSYNNLIDILQPSSGSKPSSKRKLAVSRSSSSDLINNTENFVESTINDNDAKKNLNCDENLEEKSIATSESDVEPEGSVPLPLQSVQNDIEQAKFEKELLNKFEKEVPSLPISSTDSFSTTASLDSVTVISTDVTPEFLTKSNGGLTVAASMWGQVCFTERTANVSDIRKQSHLDPEKLMSNSADTITSSSDKDKSSSAARQILQDPADIFELLSSGSAHKMDPADLLKLMSDYDRSVCTTPYPAKTSDNKASLSPPDNNRREGTSNFNDPVAGGNDNGTLSKQPSLDSFPSDSTPLRHSLNRNANNYKRAGSLDPSVVIDTETFGQRLRTNSNSASLKPSAFVVEATPQYNKLHKDFVRSGSLDPSVGRDSLRLRAVPHSTNYSGTSNERLNPDEANQSMKTINNIADNDVKSVVSRLPLTLSSIVPESQAPPLHVQTSPRFRGYRSQPPEAVQLKQRGEIEGGSSNTSSKTEVGTIISTTATKSLEPARTIPIAIPTKPIAIPNSPSSHSLILSSSMSNSNNNNISTENFKPLSSSLTNNEFISTMRPRTNSNSRSVANSSNLIMSSSPMSGSYEMEYLRDRRKNHMQQQQQQSLASQQTKVSPPQPKESGINPFRLQEGEVFSRTRTHNRRRWAHAFPKIQNLNSSSKWELNWKSLCQPAVLPLTTDYLPSIDDIKSMNFVVANYSLVIDPSVCPYSKPDKLLTEMVNQRLAQEFQTINSNEHNLEEYKKFVLGSSYKETPDEYFMILSMGHRIHFLCYIPSREIVNVYRYNSRVMTNDIESTFSYRYRVWSKQFQRFVVMHQNFYQFPEPEYAWNLTDEVLLGNQDTLSESSRPKRIRLAIVPCNGITAEQYQDCFEKLTAFLQRYCAETLTLKFDHDGMSSANKKNLNVKLWFRKPNSAQGLPQWGYLRCEDTFSMRKVFHIETYWLVCIASLMDEFINLLFRRCGSWGLRLIQIPEFFCVANLQMHPFRGNPQIIVPPFTNITYSVPIRPLINKELGINTQDEDLYDSKREMRVKTLSTKIIERDYSSPTEVIERIVLQSTSRFNKDTRKEEPSDWIPDDKQRTNWLEMGLPEPLCHLKENCPNILIRNSQSSISSLSSALGASALTTNRSYTLRTNKTVVTPNTTTVSSGTFNSLYLVGEEVNTKLSENLKSLANYASSTFQTASKKLGEVAGSMSYVDSGNEIQAVAKISGQEGLIKDDNNISYSLNSESDTDSIPDDTLSSKNDIEQERVSPRIQLSSSNTARSPSTSALTCTTLSGAASTLLSNSPNRRSVSNPPTISNMMLSSGNQLHENSNSQALFSSSSGTVKPVVVSSYYSTNYGLSSNDSPLKSPNDQVVPSNSLSVLRPKLRRHFHYDNQYMQLMGYAVVRVAARGFVWLQSSTPRVSDTEKTTNDDKRNMSEKVLKLFGEQCKSVRLCYEILIECIEEAMEIVDYEVDLKNFSEYNLFLFTALTNNDEKDCDDSISSEDDNDERSEGNESNDN